MRQLLIVLTAAAGIAACGTTPCAKPGAYLESRPGQPLRVPEDLARPPEHRRVVIPQGADTVHPELRGPYVEGPDGRLRCLEEPPPLG